MDFCASDIDSTNLTLSNVNCGVPNGTLSIVDGKLVYTPDLEFNDIIIVDCTISDGDGGSVTVKGTITVIGVPTTAVTMIFDGVEHDPIVKNYPTGATITIPVDKLPQIPGYHFVSAYPGLTITVSEVSADNIIMLTYAGGKPSTGERIPFELWIAGLTLIALGTVGLIKRYNIKV
jgi:hypothetical protein